MKDSLRSTVARKTGSSDFREAPVVQLADQAYCDGAAGLHGHRHDRALGQVAQAHGLVLARRHLDRHGRFSGCGRPVRTTVQSQQT